jgi:hypothetical protein
LRACRAGKRRNGPAFTLKNTHFDCPKAPFQFEPIITDVPYRKVKGKSADKLLICNGKAIRLQNNYGKATIINRIFGCSNNANSRQNPACNGIFLQPYFRVNSIFLTIAANYRNFASFSSLSPTL